MRVQLSPRIMDRNSAVINNSLPPRARTLSGSSVSSNNSKKSRTKNPQQQQQQHQESRRRSRHHRSKNNRRRRSDSDESSNNNNLQELELALQASIHKHGGSKEHAAHAPIYNQIGNLQFRQGNMTAAKQAYQQAILCNDSMAQAFLNLSTVYWSTGQVKEAIPLLQQAELEVLRKNDMASETMASVCHQLGLCHGLLHEFDTAIQYMNKALKIRQDNKAEIAVAKTHDALGKIYFLKEEYDAAIEHHERAFQMLKQAGCNTLPVLKNLVNTFVAMDDETTAIQIMKEMADILRQDLKNSHSKQTAQTLQDTLGAIAELHNKIGKPDDAKEYRREANLVMLASR